MTKPIDNKNKNSNKTKQEHNPLSAFEKGLLDELKSKGHAEELVCLLYTSPSPRDAHESRMPSSA